MEFQARYRVGYQPPQGEAAPGTDVGLVRAVTVKIEAWGKTSTIGLDLPEEDLEEGEMGRAFPWVLALTQAPEEITFAGNEALAVLAVLAALARRRAPVEIPGYGCLPW